MALVIKDRVKETTTTTGTGTYTLAGAEVGFQSFSTIGNGNTTYYAVTYNNDWEVGIGTYTSSGTTLARTTILSSSNSNNAVNWSSGEKSVFVTQPSSKASFLDASGNLNLSGNIVVSGTVDGRDVAADGTTADNALPKAGGTMSGDIDGNGNKVLFANVYSQLSDLPSASTYHGLFAHVHATGKALYAHAGNWINLANDADKLNLSGGAMTGAITTNSTFDGRDVATDGTKLDGIEASADVTDTANVTSAGALMDSELTNLAAVKAINQSLVTGASPTFAGLTVGGNIAVTGTVDGRDIATNIPASLGTAGQVLTVNSGANAGEWATPAGGGADLYSANESSPTAQPSATGTNAIAIGDSATATAAHDVAIGLNANATANSNSPSLAMGKDADASSGGISIGNYGSATGVYATALGTSANATATNASALGNDAKSTASDAVALGKSRAGGASSIAGSINQNSTSYGTTSVNTVAFGTQARATNNSAVSIGQSSIGSGYQSSAYGYNAVASGQDSFAGGSSTDATATRSTALGNGAQATHSNATAVGYNAVTSATNQVSLGASGYAVKVSGTYTLPTADGTNGQVMTTNGSGVVAFADAGGGSSFTLIKENHTNGTAPTVTGNDSVAIGDSASATGVDSYSFGHYASNAGNTSIAVGGIATVSANANESQALGANSIVTPASGTITNATAIGKSRASGVSSFAASIDNNTTSYGATTQYSIAIGYRAKAGSSDRSVAIGSSTEADYRAVSIGYNAGGSGSYGISLGANSGVGIYASSAAIGYNVQSTASNQVSIGGSTQDVRISETYILPKTDGTNGQVLTTNGSGVVAFADAGGGGADLYAANESSPDAQPSATGANAIAIGEASVASGSDAFAVGSDTDATGTMSMALGKGAQATANYNLAIGLNANATGERAVGIGNNGVIAGSAFSTAIGTNSGFGGSVTATGAGAMALGGSRATGVDSFAAAIANNTASYGASGANSVAIGKQAKSTAGNAVAIGSKATASSASSMSFCTSYANYGNVSSALNSFTMGDGNSASATSAIATGYGANANIQGKHAHANGSFGDGNAEGSAQRGTFVLRCDTTDATAEALRTSSGTASTNNQITLPNNSAYTFSGTIVAREKASEGTDVGSWEVKGIIRREANAGTTVLVNSVINEFNAPTGWAVALTADTTNGCLKIAVTGVASTNIRWVATINTSEVTYA